MDIVKKNNWMFFVFFIIVIDIWLRIDIVTQYIDIYIISGISSLFLIIFLRELIFIAGKFLVIFFSVIIGIIYGTQYLLFRTYQQFIMPDDLGVLLQNIHYWVKNSPSL
ncbi:hypothetical protein QUF61_16560, partial [Candidatus Venteria ishoeyi]|uniref:hypothetical protein n=1 Tax=Candidatus Venteria ishoeyi TaxID=1899563 RepID=UPI0025A55AC1